MCLFWGGCHHPNILSIVWRRSLLLSRLLSKSSSVVTINQEVCTCRTHFYLYTRLRRLIIDQLITGRLPILLQTVHNRTILPTIELENYLRHFLPTIELENYLRHFLPTIELENYLRHFLPTIELENYLRHFLPTIELENYLRHFLPTIELENYLRHLDMLTVES